MEGVGGLRMTVEGVAGNGGGGCGGREGGLRMSGEEVVGDRTMVAGGKRVRLCEQAEGLMQ